MGFAISRSRSSASCHVLIRPRRRPPRRRDHLPRRSQGDQPLPGSFAICVGVIATMAKDGYTQGARDRKANWISGTTTRLRLHQCRSGVGSVYGHISAFPRGRSQDRRSPELLRSRPGPEEQAARRSMCNGPGHRKLMRTRNAHAGRRATAGRGALDRGLVSQSAVLVAVRCLRRHAQLGIAGTRASGGWGGSVRSGAYHHQRGHPVGFPLRWPYPLLADDVVRGSQVLPRELPGAGDGCGLYTASRCEQTWCVSARNGRRCGRAP